jgi:hypothetical protein
MFEQYHVNNQFVVQIRPALLLPVLPCVLPRAKAARECLTRQRALRLTTPSATLGPRTSLAVWEPPGPNEGHLLQRDAPLRYGICGRTASLTT